MQAILFDSDGVLVDTELIFFDATRAAFERTGIALSRDQWAQWYLAEGKRSREIAALLGMGSSIIPPTLDMRNEMFWNRIDQGVPVFPDVRDTLALLAPRFTLAVVTGAARPHYDRVHAATGLADFFSVVVTRDTYEHAKPHPQAYLTALNLLGLKPGESLAVEDSPRGAAAAVAAGIPCCIIPTCLTNLSLCPKGCTVIDRFGQLTELTR